MIRSYEDTIEGYVAAEKFADEWAGDNETLAIIVERFTDKLHTLEVGSPGVELFVIGGEKAIHYEKGHDLRAAAGMVLNVTDGRLETQYRTDQRPSAFDR